MSQKNIEVFVDLNMLGEECRGNQRASVLEPSEIDLCPLDARLVPEDGSELRVEADGIPLLLHVFLFVGGDGGWVSGMTGNWIGVIGEIVEGREGERDGIHDGIDSVGRDTESLGKVSAVSIDCGKVIGEIFHGLAAELIGGITSEHQVPVIEHLLVALGQKLLVRMMKNQKVQSILRTITGWGVLERYFLNSLSPWDCFQAGRSGTVRAYKDEKRAETSDGYGPLRYEYVSLCCEGEVLDCLER